MIELELELDVLKRQLALHTLANLVVLNHCWSCDLPKFTFNSVRSTLSRPLIRCRRIACNQCMAVLRSELPIVLTIEWVLGLII